MKKILFADLDDTLFQSHRKSNPEESWVPKAYLTNGSPISFASPKQQIALELFLREMIVIPVTARNFDAYRRVDIDFPSEAIINYGGIVLNADGAPDEFWLEQSKTRAHEKHEDLERWVSILTLEGDKLGLDLRVRLISDFGIPFYVVAKSVSANIESVRAAAVLCRSLRDNGTMPDCHIHENTNNLALIPRWLGKESAVAYLRQRYASEGNEILTIGMGDSLVDLGFMASCDYMLVPSSSQIARDRLGEVR